MIYSINFDEHAAHRVQFFLNCAWRLTNPLIPASDDTRAAENCARFECLMQGLKAFGAKVVCTIGTRSSGRRYILYAQINGHVIVQDGEIYTARLQTALHEIVTGGNRNENK